MADISSMGWMGAAGGLIQAWGAMEQGKAARAAGERARVAGEFDAWNADREAGLTIALSQRRAREEVRQSDMAASRAMAVAAASGGGVSDPTIVNLLANVRGEGVYRSNVALYEGEARARELRIAGATGRLAGAESALEGVNRQTGAMYSAFGSLAKTGASLYEKFGGGGPKSETTPTAADRYSLDT